jgi:hypothetical protein
MNFIDIEGGEMTITDTDNELKMTVESIEDIEFFVKSHPGPTYFSSSLDFAHEYTDSYEVIDLANVVVNG